MNPAWYPDDVYPNMCGMSYLDEPDILALFPEALTADVEAIFADQTGLVGANTAVEKQNKCQRNSFSRFQI